jgi:hypothetical protein
VFPVPGIDGWRWTLYVGFLPTVVDGPIDATAYDADGEEIESVGLAVTAMETTG